MDIDASARPFAGKKFHTVLGRRMAAIDEGSGRSIVFQHGNPTSSYLWRNVMRGCRGLGRLIACDLIGMGDSNKILGTGDARYSWEVHYEHLCALWDRLELGTDIVLVIHDWGSSLGLQWAMDHADRVAGIVYMEAIVTAMTWEHWPENARGIFRGFRSGAGEELIFEKNLFIEGVLRRSVMRDLSEAEMDEYRRPFLAGDEDRRPMLAWPRQIPLDGEPARIPNGPRAMANSTAPARRPSCSSTPSRVRSWSGRRAISAAPGPTSAR